MEGPAFDGDVGGVDPSPSGGVELAPLELALAELVVAPEVASIIEVDIGVPSGAVDAVVALLGGELNIAGSHK